ncbi:monocarboxylate transporter 12-like [Ostrinia furnacalis]|uniref:monocarboxylate transporter 12-like n=1 Tax=Ostrinia furnacalis TaxID=93504 RepID=UPI0010401291|nr:monocarboxylate transporter 12-like [Ostrinia furnacalis]
MLIGVSNIFGMAGLYVPFVYIVDAAMMNGVEAGKASFLLSIIGITNTIGRIACGWVADFPWMDSLLLNNLCLVIATVTSLPYSNSKRLFAKNTVIQGDNIK